MSQKDQTNNIAYGIMFGMMVGDAIGAPFEFMKSSHIKEMVKKNPKILEMGAYTNPALPWKPGQITDDSEAALALLFALFYGVKPENILKNYITWYRSNPLDIGNTMRKVFHQASENLHAMSTENALKAHKPDEVSLSNGTLMRAAPMAIYAFAKWKQLVFPYREKMIYDLVQTDVKMTHSNQEIITATYIYVSILFQLLYQNDSIHNSQVPRPVWIQNMLFQYRGMHPEVDKVLMECFHYAVPSGLTADGDKMGYYKIALQNGLYQMIYATDFRSAMMNTIMLGGDVDTNCAVAGALCGALFKYTSIPTDWVSKIINFDYSIIRKNYPFVQHMKKLDGYLVSLLQNPQ